MIPCEHCEELISVRLDGQLTDQDALLLEEHLDQCPDCRKLDRDLTALQERMRKLSVDPPEGFAATVLSQLEPPMVQPVKKKKKAPWAAIACAAAAVVLMFVVLTPQMLPFGEDTAAETADIAEPAMETAPQEEAAAEPAQSTAGTADMDLDNPNLLTQNQALKVLEDYLSQEARSLSITPSSLSEDGASWSFTARDVDSGERFLFFVFRSDGFVEEVLIP